MFAEIKHLFGTPIFEGEDNTAAANLLNIMSLTLLPTLLFSGILASLFFFPRGDFRTYLVFGLFAAVLIIYIVLRFGYVQLASTLLILVLWGAFTFALMRLGGVRVPAFSIYIIITLIAGMLLGRTGGYIVAGLGIGAGIGLYIAEMVGLIVYSNESIMPLSARLGLNIFLLIVVVVMIYLYTARLGQALQRSQNSEVTLARSSRELQAVRTSLEDQIAARTRTLEIVADISQQLTTILDGDELLKTVVDRIRTAFNVYQTNIYLIEEYTGDLVLAESSGAAARVLKDIGHRLTADQGLVGAVAKTNEPILSNNVNTSLVFVHNPWLSNTKSELAVPLHRGEEVIGVLDIQSKQADRFTIEQLSLMQVIANQISIALHTSQLIAPSHVLMSSIGGDGFRDFTRNAWDEFVKEDIEVSAYRFDGRQNVVSPATEDDWLTPMARAAARKQLVKQGFAGNGNDSEFELAVPLMLRGEVIGVLGVRRQEAPDWAVEEVAAVEAVADQIARALENARLSKEQEKTIEQLKEVDRLKSEFLTSISHELRTPLNSIIGFADVLLQGIDGELNDMAITDIQLIYNSGQHLLTLINDVLDLSKIEAGKMELLPEWIDVHDLINDVISIASSLLRNNSVTVKVEGDRRLPHLFADKLRLNQILLNLVSNAAKFTSKGSITIKAESGPNNVRISVTDTGIGIPPSKQQTIFDRFWQADNSITREYGGTGLGLAICKQLVELHDGEIGVISKEGVGSTFYFTIPVVEGAVVGH